MRRMAIFWILLAGLFGMNYTQAQSQREQLNQLVTQLQVSPGDTALRERIIKLAQEIKPPPSVPEEARRHFVEGTAIAKSAQNAAQQALAVQSFQEALKVAPWWGDVYYNLAVAQELAGQFDAAQDALKYYILTNPGEKEVREAQDRIYALNAKKRLATAAQNTPEAAADRARRGLEGLEGSIWIAPLISVEMDPRYNNGRTMMYQRPAYSVRNRQLVRSKAIWYSGQLDPGYSAGDIIESIPLSGTRTTYRTRDIDDNCNPITLEISEDGNRLTQHYSCYGRTIAYPFARTPR